MGTLHDERLRIGTLRRRIATLAGAKAEGAARRAVLVREIGLAKGRIELRDQVESFLEGLQQDAHRRNVGSFERLLTLLVQEVLPGSNPIGFDLSTERGLPSLDIFSARPDGLREDVFDDQGGALTNIVCAGLRIIAVVKSRGRPFLVLDEPDCWIRPDRVPDFYKVLRQAAERLKVQCLVISHHSRDLFGPGIAIATLDGETGAIESPSAADFPWTDDAPGFRSVRLENFQAHRDVTLRLAPGVTALVGPNNRGKSSLTRAFSAVFYGNTRDSLISHHAKSCAVEIAMENGRSVRFTRERKRNPVNLWSLHEADGAVVEEDGIRYETGGRGVPDWIATKTRIATVDGLEVNVAGQKMPVFLLADPPAKRATVLSVGQESGHLRSMIVLQRERTTKDLATVRNGEREITEIDARLAELASTEEWDGLMSEAETGLEAAAESADVIARMEATLASLEAARHRAEICRAKAAALTRLPEPKVVEQIVRVSARIQRIAATLGTIESGRTNAARAADRLRVLAELQDPPAVVPTDRAAVLAAEIGRATAAQERLRRRAAALAGLPEQAPPLVDNTRILDLGVAIRKGMLAIEAARGKDGELAVKLGEAETEMQSLLDAMGGMCPTCHQPVADAVSLLGHSHGDAA